MADYKRKMGIEEDKDSSAYYREKEARRMNAPSKYDSIRSSGEEERLSTRKSEGLKRAALGVGVGPMSVALETALGRSGGSDKGPIGAGAEHFAGAGNRLMKATGEVADDISGSINQYKKAKAEEAALDRELENQTKRETRGMKKGGKVSASSRADGAAIRGKTRGRIY